MACIRMCLHPFRLGCPVILLLAWASLVRAAVPPSAEALPATTHHFLSIPDVARLKADWKQTPLSRLMDEPGIEATLKQATQRGIDSLGLGIRWEDLEAVGGEAAWAFVQPTPKQTGRVFLLDMTNKLDAAKKFQADLPRRLARDGYELSKQKIDATEVQVVKKDNRIRYFTLHGSFFLATNNLATMQTMLAVKREKSLARLEGYREVRKRSEAQTKTPFRAFIYSAPFELARARRLRGAVALAGRDMLALAERQGFDAIKAIGTGICFGSKTHELSYHMAFHAPGPYRNAAQLLRFPVEKEFTQPDWVPANLSACATLCFDAKKGISAISSAFDEIYGNGKKGSFDRILEDWKNDSSGPMVDVEKDIVGHLSRRVTILTDTDLKLGPYAVRTLVAFETTNPTVVSRSLRRMLETDDEIKRREFKGFVLWEFQPRAKKSKPGEKPTTPPSPAVCVAHGHLLFSSNVRLLERILTRGEQSLAKDADFERVQAEIRRLAPANVAMRAYTRPDQDYRVAYEAFRSGKLTESKSIYALLLSQFVGSGDDALLDPKKLPAFDRLAPHLGPAGMFLIPQEDGWVLNGFSLPRKR